MRVMSVITAVNSPRLDGVGHQPSLDHFRVGRAHFWLHEVLPLDGGHDRCRTYSSSGRECPSKREQMTILICVAQQSRDARSCLNIVVKQEQIAWPWP